MNSAIKYRGIFKNDFAIIEFMDFHCLMNNEIIFLHQPEYLVFKDFKLSEDELKELDSLAELLLEPDKNFDAIRNVWERETKFRILRGGMN